MENGNCSKNKKTNRNEKNIRKREKLENKKKPIK